MVTRRVLVALFVLPAAGVLAQAALEIPRPPDERPCYKSPLGLAIDPTSRFAYVALHSAGTLAVVDLKNNRVVEEVVVGRGPYDVALHKGIAYVTCEADDTLVAVDVKARKVKRVYKVPQAPRGVTVDRQTGRLSVVCHDEQVLWTLDSDQAVPKKEPIPPQPEGNFARASSLELVPGSQPSYRLAPRPFGLFTPGQVPLASPNTPAGTQPAPETAPARTAFNPILDHVYGQTGMDLVAHTRPRWFTSTVRAQEGRIFTNAFSFFVNPSSTAVVLLDEPKKGYPDPTDVVVKLPYHFAGKKAVPLASGSSADTHPLKGARVFISSGGADTVVVLDLYRAAKHFETHQFFQPLGFTGMGGFSMGGYSMGGMMGGSMGGFQFSGANMGGNFSGSPAPVAVPAAPIRRRSSGKPPAATPAPAPGQVTTGMGMPGQPATGMGMIGMMGGAQLGGFQFNGFMAGGLGWQGGFSPLIEDLQASAHYTLARLPTQANPRRMALTPNGRTLVVSNHLADSLTLIDAERLRVLRHISLGGPEPDRARRGEILFHSAKATFQQQFTCATCHPGGGSDGLAWDTSEKATGEHLNTRSLHGVRDTVPFGWRGESDTLAARVKNTMRHVHRHQISDADASAIAAYLETLDPPRPLPQQKKDQPAIAHGRELFFGKAECTRCHRGPAFTSASPRAVVLDFKNHLTEFDVPSLRGVGRSAPYLHDGRAGTLADIFQQFNPRKRHGQAHRLTAGELNDLVAYLKTL